MSGGSKRAFRSNIVWQLVGNGGQAIIGGVILVLMGRALGVYDFGVFAIVMGLVYVANGLFEPRIQDVAAKQFWDVESDETGRHAPYFVDLFLLEAAAKMLPSIGLVLASPFLANFNKIGDLAIIPLAALGYYVGKLGNGLAIGTLRVLGRSDLSSLCLIVEQALRLAIMLAIVAAGHLTAFNAVLTLCVAAIIANTLQWWLVRRQLTRVKIDLNGWRFSEAGARLRENRRLIISNISLSISDLMNKDLDVTIISPMMSPAAVGIYKMAKNIVILAWKVVDPVYLALMPEVNRLAAQRDFAALTGLIRRTSVWLFALAVFLSVGVGVGVWLFGGMVLGQGFADIYRYVWVMLIGILIASPLIWGHAVLVALNRADAVVYGILAAAILGIGVLFLLTPILGLYGVICGWIVTFGCTFIFTAVAALRRLRQVRADPALLG